MIVLGATGKMALDLCDCLETKSSFIAELHD